MSDEREIYLGPVCDEPELDDGDSVATANDVPPNCLYLPAPLKKADELDKLETAYRYARHLPPVVFEEPPDEE